MFNPLLIHNNNNTKILDICFNEEKFDIEIPDSDAESIATVGDAVKYIESKNS